MFSVVQFYENAKFQVSPNGNPSPQSVVGGSSIGEVKDPPNDILSSQSVVGGSSIGGVGGSPNGNPSPQSVVGGSSVGIIGVLEKDQLKKIDLKELIKAAVEEAITNKLEPYIEKPVKRAVDNAVAESFAKFAALHDLNEKSLELEKDWANDPVANHHKIDCENDLSQWNLRLEDNEYCQKYLQYFVDVLPQKTYAGKGDNALYAVVDYLFTRELFTKFTWTGISRAGGKSTRGFREFAKVISLLIKLVHIADPTYTPDKVAEFFKKRIFRYSKKRSTGKQLRKSSFRPLRGSKHPKIPKLEEGEDNGDEEMIEMLEYDAEDGDDEEEQDEKPLV